MQRAMGGLAGLWITLAVGGCAPWMMQLPPDLTEQGGATVIPVGVERYAVMGTADAVGGDPGVALSIGDSRTRIVEAHRETLVTEEDTEPWYSSWYTDELKRHDWFVFTVKEGKSVGGQRVECLVVREGEASTLTNDSGDMSLTTYNESSGRMDCRVWYGKALVATLSARKTVENGAIEGTLEMTHGTFGFHSVHHVTNFSMRKASPVGYVLTQDGIPVAGIQFLDPQNLWMRKGLSVDGRSAAVLMGASQYYREQLTEGLARMR